MINYNTLIVLLGVGLLGAGAGLVGSFAVLRRRALLGDALSHAALPGLCLGFLVLGERNLPMMLLGALATGLLGIATVSFLCHWTRVRLDAAIGIVLSVFFGFGIVLSRMIQNMTTAIGSKAGLDSYILGKTAGIVAADVALIAGAAAACVGLVSLLFKEFLLVSFDPQFGRVQGWPAPRIDLLLTGLVAVVVAIGLPAVGVVMMAALLIIPGVTARFWTARLSRLILLAAILGASMGLVGTAISASYDKMPAGPVITLVGTVLFLASALAAPERGLVARLMQRRRDRWRADYDQILRLLYEFTEAGENREFEELLKAKSWSHGRVRKLSSGMLQARDAEFGSSGALTLTASGKEKAVDVVRLHRQWQLLVTEYPDLVPLARPQTGEPVEATIAAEVVADLTNKLRAAGRWPEIRPEGAFPRAEWVR